VQESNNQPAAVPAPNQSILERNLRALSLRSAPAVAMIRQASPIGMGGRTILFELSADGLLTGRMAGPGESAASARLLASARGVEVEAQRFAESVDIKTHAAFVVRGFGIGHHLRTLSQRVGHNGVIVCFEPDVGLLRAVLERIDITEWMRASRLVLITRADDLAAMAAGIDGLEGLIAAGLTVVDHPPSKSRLADHAEAFAQTLKRLVQGVRTNVVTTLAHSEVTLRNLLGNAPIYLDAPGVAELENCQQGRPAVVVSAGPSLRRNIELLATPGLRDRVVIIAAQTVLKQLLSRGIKPHFVTALDYHEISTRFYEGLRPADVEGIELVIDPKANCAIPRAFPGKVGCVGEDVLTRVMGPLARDMGSVPAGATVAHLSYYLARHLGCDPVLLMGQDLGFTDGQYYAPGAAIHQVWSNELNAFTSLESLEWQRIMRMRAHLRKATDQQGRDIYTDEQMATYLLQFERDFQRDEAAGKTTIDATEGGVRKQHTRIMPLREALEQLGVIKSSGIVSTTASPASSLDIPVEEFTLDLNATEVKPLAATPALAPFPTRPASPSRRAELLNRLESLAQQARAIARDCDLTKKELEQMLRHHGDHALVDRLIERVHKRAIEVTQLEAHWLVQHLNQAGTLNRFKADRSISLDDDASPLERQKRQIERDIQNVSWLGDAARSLLEMLGDAEHATRSGKAPTRTPTPQDASLASQTGVDGRARRVIATLWVDPRPEGGVMGWRELAKPTLGCPTALAATLSRLHRIKDLDGIVLVTDDAPRVRDLLRASGDALAKRVRIHELTPGQGDRVRGRLRCVRAARILTRHSWRTGIANVCVYDELLEPRLWRDVLAASEADAALLVGPEWCAIDPHLCSRVIERYREAPLRHGFTFTQAAVGLCGAVASAGMIDQLASDARSGWLGTLGQLLGYHPLSPMIDPIAKPFCVQVTPQVRDLPIRCCIDDANAKATLERVHATNPLDSLDATQLAAALATDLQAQASDLAPEELIIRVTATDSDRWLRIAERLATQRRAWDNAPIVLTIEDRTAEGPWRELADVARKLGFAGLHARFGHEALARPGGPGGPGGGDVLIEAMDIGVDAVSIDMAGDSRATWLARTGTDTMQTCWDAMQAALDERNTRSGRCLPRTWIVPRLTRCDATYDDIEGFYDRWMLTWGACALDPLEHEQPGDRIAPLPLPGIVANRRAWSIRRIDTSAIPLGPARERVLAGASFGDDLHAPI
jgi:hypothetical protein